MSIIGIDHTVNVIIAAFVVLISIVFYFTYHRFKTTKKCVLILGTSGAGKTLVYTRLILKCFKVTQTSTKENASQFITGKGSSIDLLEVPGDKRLRESIFQQFKKSARGIIFVIDSSTIEKELKDVADFLYCILTDSDIIELCENILIFCNKQDAPLAKGAGSIKTILEKELNILRRTRSSALEHEGSDKDSCHLGSPAADFVFEQLYPTTVDFAEGYANQGEASEGEYDLDQIIAWMDKTA
uniref:Signal recognition particle receptor subunit beta n=1 Tax=Lygus hesperus TaxID=30085 RepID=A0A146L2Y0_LYGHE